MTRAKARGRGRGRGRGHGEDPPHAVDSSDDDLEISVSGVGIGSGTGGGGFVYGGRSYPYPDMRYYFNPFQPPPPPTSAFPYHAFQNPNFQPTSGPDQNLGASSSSVDCTYPTGLVSRINAIDRSKREIRKFSNLLDEDRKELTMQLHMFLATLPKNVRDETLRRAKQNAGKEDADPNIKQEADEDEAEEKKKKETEPKKKKRKRG